MSPRPAGQLPARRRVPSDGPRHLLEAHAENVMEEKCRALERRKPFQRHHQRQRDIVHALRFRSHHRFGKPGPYISLALSPRRFEHVEAEPCHDPAQKRLCIPYRALVDLQPAQKGVLHHVLGFGHRTEHTVGDADQLGPQRRKTLRCGPMSGSAHHATFLPTAVGNGTRRPILTRLKALIAPMSKVILICSSSLKCALNAS